MLFASQFFPLTLTVFLLTTIVWQVQPSAATPKTYQYTDDQQRHYPQSYQQRLPEQPRYFNRPLRQPYDPEEENDDEVEEGHYNSKQPNRHNMPQQQQKFAASARLNQPSGGERALAQPNVAVGNHNQKKCRKWVPSESVDKYPESRQIQLDQANHMTLIEVCCRGYRPERFKSDTLCQPVCENCRNGYCMTPGDCHCYKEFVRNDNGDCVFTCPLGCLNGQCYLDGSCQCDAGYTLDETRRFCRPICSAGCGLNVRHNCTEPEVCGCAKGYQLMDGGCQPTCQPDCGDGGYCRELNVCECKPDFQLKNGVCQSDCYQKCENGVCFGRNRCICNTGFSYHERSRLCVPV